MFRSTNVKSQLLFGVMIAILLATLVGIQPVSAARICTIRYYLSPMIGAGTEEDPFRPLVADLPNYPKKTFATAWEAKYNLERQDYALVAVASTNHKPLLKNPDLGPLPDIPLESDIWSDPEVFTLLQSSMAQFGSDPEILVEAGNFGEVLFYISRDIDFWNPGIPVLDTCPLK